MRSIAILGLLLPFWMPAIVDADDADGQGTSQYSGHPSRYLGDNLRSGYTDAEVPKSPERLWTFIEQHPPRQAWKEPNREEQYIDFDYATQVAIGGDLVVFGSSADHTVRAIDLVTGASRWDFYTEGPIRFAPVIDGTRVFVASDDGHLYCLQLTTGKLIWSFRGGPSDGKLIGNDQMISHWPARSGVMVEGDKLYFTAGMWSRDGVFIYCLNPDDGSVRWKNDTSGFYFTSLPHSAGFGGVAPQGYLALHRNRLFVPTGRGAPACFDAETGVFLYYENGYGYKPHQPGGSRVMAWKDWVIFKRRSQHIEESVRYDPRVAGPGAASGLFALDIRTGEPAWSLTDKNVVAGHGRHLILGGAGPVIKVDLQEVLKGYENFWKDGKNLGPDPNIVDPKLDYTRASQGGKLIPSPAWMTPLPYKQWEADVGQVFVLLCAGDTVLAGGPGKVSAIDFQTGRVIWQQTIDGDARGIGAIDRHFVVSSTVGKLYCFGKPTQRAVTDPDRVIQPTLNQPSSDPSAVQLAREILRSGGVREGYAVMLGVGDGQLLCELARQSDLVIYCLEEDREKVHHAQKVLDETGLLGVRAAVHYGTLDRLPYNPYVANLLIWGDRIGSGTSKVSARELHRVLRPYGGVAVQVASNESEATTRSWLAQGDILKTEVSKTDVGVVVTRGPLEGAGQWTHAYANIGRTSSSEDSLARLPLGMAWWGGPGPERIVSRHWRAPVPLFSNGVLYVQGQHDVVAVDAYNGREMWDRHLEGVGRFPPNKRGGNIVADGSSVFCVLGTKCLRLDAQTGETLTEFEFPVTNQHIAAIEQLKRNATESSSDTRLVWEYLGVTGDYVIGTLGYESIDLSANPDALAPSQAKFVFVFGKSTGKLLWQKRLDRAVSSLAIVADDQRLYLLDRTDERLYVRLVRRGGSEFASSIVAIELATGETAWEKPNIAIQRKALILKDDVIVAYPNPTETERRDADSGVAVYSAADGKLMWEETASPGLGDDRRGHLVRHTFIIGNTLFLPDAHDLCTGKPLLLKHSPLTGLDAPFMVCGKNFCGTIAAGKDILAYRSASLGFQEVSRDSGSFWFPEIRPSCWISVVPAGGLVLAPEGYSTCICPYNYKTSLALLPVERYEDWSIYLSGRQEKRITAAKKKNNEAATMLTPHIRELRLNLNAPGDRMDADGHLWLAYPRPIAGKVPYIDTELPIELDGVQSKFRYNADLHTIGGTDQSWLYTSGLEGPVMLSIELSEDQDYAYDVQMFFAETADVAPGDRVFNVKIQKKTVLSHCDIASQAGGADKASIHDFKGIAARGTMTIELVPVKGKPPRICSLVITQAGESH